MEATKVKQSSANSCHLAAYQHDARTTAIYSGKYHEHSCSCFPITVKLPTMLLTYFVPVNETF